MSRLEERNQVLNEQLEGITKFAKEVEKEKDSYKKALEFYADEDNHENLLGYSQEFTEIEMDKGDKARQALKEAD